MNPNAASRLGLEFLQAFWEGDFERGYRLCATDAMWRFQRTLHDPQDVPVRSAVEFLVAKLIGGFAPDSGYSVELRDAIGEGNEAAVEYSASGLTRRGQTYRNNYVVRFTVNDGKIVSIRPYFDTHHVSRMLYPLD